MVYMTSKKITELTAALGERLDLCQDQVEEYKRAEQMAHVPPDRHSGWQSFANEASTAISLVQTYASADITEQTDDIPAKVAADLRSQFGDIDLARHIETNDLRAIDCNTPDADESA